VGIDQVQQPVAQLRVEPQLDQFGNLRDVELDRDGVRVARIQRGG
jgi:hypothetical protein